MSAHEDQAASRRGGWFVRAAETAGDLGNPFYAEERERDVWNEACAVGLQVMLWVGTAAATVLVWVAGGPAIPYAMVLLGVVGVASLVTVLYAGALGVEVDDPRGILRLRLVAFLALLVLFLQGVVRAAPTSGFGGGFAKGLLFGAVAGVVALVWSAMRARRRREAEERQG